MTHLQLARTRECVFPPYNRSVMLLLRYLSVVTCPACGSYIKLFECLGSSCFAALLMWETECSCCLQSIELRAGHMSSWVFALNGKKLWRWSASLWLSVILCDVLSAAQHVFNTAPKRASICRDETIIVLLETGYRVLPPYIHCMKINCLSFSQTATRLVAGEIVEQWGSRRAELNFTMMYLQLNFQPTLSKPF